MGEVMGGCGILVIGIDVGSVQYFLVNSLDARRNRGGVVFLLLA
jgi:hypothetical protein